MTLGLMISLMQGGTALKHIINEIYTISIPKAIKSNFEKLMILTINIELYDHFSKEEAAIRPSVHCMMMRYTYEYTT